MKHDSLCQNTHFDIVKLWTGFGCCHVDRFFSALSFLVRGPLREQCSSSVWVLFLKPQEFPRTFTNCAKTSEFEEFIQTKKCYYNSFFSSAKLVRGLYSHSSLNFIISLCKVLLFYSRVVLYLVVFAPGRTSLFLAVNFLFVFQFKWLK